MKIYFLSTLRAFWEDRRHPNAEPALRRWFNICSEVGWRDYAEARQTYRTADQVRLDCGGKGNKTVTVFNVGGNKYRIVTLIDYTLGSVVVTHVLTHKDYDKERWKRQVCEGLFPVPQSKPNARSNDGASR